MVRIVAAFLLLLLPSTTHAQKRVALVIGNSAYTDLAPLKNPRNDAVDLSNALNRLGFEVISGFDLARTEMEASLERFAQSSVGASLAVLFFAGHGIQTKGENYLIPVDARLPDEASVAGAALALHEIIKRIERVAVSSLILLDACRDNPLAPAATPGTATQRPPSGLAPLRTRRADLLIGFATEPDAVAFDGTGRNSPYTLALLRYIAVPGQEITSLMREVRREVMFTTHDNQVPWEHSSLREAVYLVRSPDVRPNLPRPRVVTYEQDWKGKREDARGRTLGSFKRIDADSWRELVQTSGWPSPDPAPVTFDFKQEESSDPRQIFLVDRQRLGGPMWVRLDLIENRIYWRQTTETWNYIYNISAVD